MQERGTRLKARIRNWKEAFSDETSGIYSTLADLHWKYAAFRTAVAIIRHANDHPGKGHHPNRMLFDLIAESFWMGTLLGVRRLLDRGDLTGDKGVFSLRSVIKDVEACSGQLTRRVFVEEIADLPYDYEAIERAEYEHLKSLPPGTPVWGSTEAFTSRLRHEHFDFLSGVSAPDRRPRDKIRKEIFDRLEARLTTLDGIAKHVSTHIAHAGNSKSRTGWELSQFDTRDARSALKELTEVAHLAGGWFAYDGASELAVAQYDKFEGLDLPLISTEGIEDLERNWQRVEQDISSWLLVKATDL
ncbi:hypothetical protein [Ensifer aridi]|uniref:AbiU2 domain-containing protein n=1 Tax=Ensifer aridi TaxID=1708715 RepID=UPI0035900DB0